MTEEEKAKELIEKFRPLVKTWDCYNDEPLPDDEIMADMKKCALIAIDFAEKILEEYDERTEEYLKHEFGINYTSAELQNMEQDFRFITALKNQINNL